MSSDAIGLPAMQLVGFRGMTALIHIKAGKSTCDVGGDRIATQTFSYRSRLSSRGRLHEDGYCEALHQHASTQDRDSSESIN
jgi:hypothetical protein